MIYSKKLIWQNLKFITLIKYGICRRGKPILILNTIAEFNYLNNCIHSLVNDRKIIKSIFIEVCIDALSEKNIGHFTVLGIQGQQVRFLARG